ncbi:transmembrane and coiled-coil domain-containing protein 4 [Babesia caballi]|uniref:Transmembrane and coiled-coil domain-containing protein 4 n=1 Tax=Babesia caballi TaxID=5871 RepID=A0AAV4LYY9_BABCB|nr:transmembrane and coiled-coil domain-containing protein 4 [Babesia caballi]
MLGIQRSNRSREPSHQGPNAISKSMERKIAQGDTELEQLESEQCVALTNTLQLLIDTSDVVADAGAVLPEKCRNTRIAYSQQIIQQLSEKRFKERLDGVSVANSVQYIRFRQEYLGELPEDLRTAIMSVLVALVVNYIAKSRSCDQAALIKWGNVILKRIGKLLKLSDIMLDALTKPAAQYATLSELKVDIEGVVKKQEHLQIIHQQLQQMQPELDVEFKSRVEEAKNYLNSPEMVGNVARHTERGLLSSISKKINRVISRAMEPTVSAQNRDPKAGGASNPHEEPEAYPDSQGEEHWLEDDDAEAVGDVSLDDELLLDSVPGSAVLLCSLVTAYILSGHNDSRVQLLFQEFSAALGMSTHTVLALENHIAAELASAIRLAAPSGSSKMSRGMTIGAVAASGGVIIAATAGVVVPAVAAGLAVLGLGGAGVSRFWPTTEDAQLFASVFGVGSSGLQGWKGKKVTSKVDVDFHHVNGQSGRSLAVCIGVCGTLSPDVEVAALWDGAIKAPLCDFYAMEWETSLLKSLGRMSQQMQEQPFSRNAALFWQKQTQGQYLECAVQWPLPLVNFATPLDNAWVVAKQKATLCGTILAQAIMDRQAVGERPISLVGYSMGARVILHALLKLKEHQRLNLVKDVVLMGLPSTVGPAEWVKCCSVVAGRLINVYSRHDWMLGYLYRHLDSGVTVAGLRPVVSEDVENYDATDFIKAHHDYMSKISDILTLVHVDL